MAYGNETEEEKEERFATERATRERRAQERGIKKQRKEALNRATSTSQRREIKKEAEEAILKINGSSSAGGNQKGGVYDISTNNYSQPERNQTNQDVSTEEAGIDSIGGSSSLGGGGGGGSNVQFNGSVLICINGSPFYIDIPYDTTAGVYPLSDGANYPITAP